MSTFARRCSALAATVAACAFLLAPAQAQTVLRLAHHHGIGGTVDQTASKFAEIVAARSKGALQIKVFPAAQLGQEREAFGLCNTGVVDLSITSLAILDQVYPAINVTSLPFVFRDWDHVDKLYDGEFGAALSEGIRKQSNTYPLGYLHLGFRDMLFRGDPIRDVAGMKGIKMRSPEATMWFRMFELLGARPTPVTWGEVYTAMQTGVADGLEAPPMVALDSKFNEVVKGLVKTNHMFASMGIFANGAKFAGLPKEQQELLVAAGREATDWSNKTISRPGEQEAYKRMTALGMQVADPTEIQAWSKPMMPLWKDTASKYPGADRLLSMIQTTK